MKRLLSMLVCLAVALCCAGTVLAEDASLGNAAQADSLLRPMGLWADGAGLIIADDGSNTVYTVTDGEKSPLAGQSLLSDVYGQAVDGYRDGAAEQALFAMPWAIAPWNGGWAVSDPQNHVVRLVLDGQVYTLTGTGQEGSAQGHAANAQLKAPMGLAVDGDGLLYIADSGSGMVLTMTSEGEVTELLTELNQPTGLCWYEGKLYICETGANRVLTWDGEALTTLAGSGETGFTDGAVSGAAFSGPQGVLATADGVYVSDTGNSAIRLIFDGLTSTLGQREAMEQWPISPVGLALMGQSLYIADPGAETVLVFDLAETHVAYNDVATGAWYYDLVMEMTGRGLLTGVSEGAFAPDAQLTRAMTAQILYRYVQSRNRSAILTGELAFTDVAEDDWCAQAVAFCAGAGLVNGYGDGSFGPNQPVTRQELAVMLFRLAQYLQREPEAAGDLSAFTDGAAVADFADEAVRWAVKEGVLQGDGGAISPNASATRAQASALLARTLVWLEA